MLCLNIVSCMIDDSLLTKLFEHIEVQHIERLFLRGDFAYLNLDSFVNLKLLSLGGTIKEGFNCELFKNLCNRLEVLKVALIDIDEKIFLKLFDGHAFSNLHYFSIIKCKLNILKKEFISRFPMLRQLFIIDCNLEAIEHDAFSNLKQLYCLDLSQNRLKFIEKDTFSKIENLRWLDLSKNKLTILDAKSISIRFKKYVEIMLENENFATFCRYWRKNQ